MYTYAKGAHARAPAIEDTPIHWAGVPHVALGRIGTRSRRTCGLNADLLPGF
jgi:hypothetical protein